MKILSFILANWDSVLIIIFFIAGIVTLIVKKEYAILDKIALSLVVEAEKQYGDGTGAVKLASVIDWIYPKIPKIIRLFMSEKQLENIIEKALEEAKKKWGSNSKLSDYISQ